jgi:flagellar hook-associated protein 1 FlgK
MGLSSVFSTAKSGLRVAQGGMQLVAQNVSNADAPGYSRKIMGLSTKVAGDKVVGVQVSSSQRALDAMLQRQLRTEVAGDAFADTRSRYLSRVDALYGPPGSEVALPSIYDRFVQSAQRLSTTPDNELSRGQFLADTGILVDRISGISNDLQSLRLETEQALSGAVTRLNDALKRLQDINIDVISESAGGQEPGNLLDQRDQVIDEIASLVDINVSYAGDNSVRVFTKSGMLLFDRQPIQMRFDARGSLQPTDLYSSDPNQRRVGGISLVTDPAGATDMIGQGVFRSGEIASLIQLRDKDLVAAQDGLDEFAHQLSRAMSDRKVDSLADFASAGNIAKATAGVAVAPVTDGFGVSLPAQGGGFDPMLPGDSLTVNMVVGGVNRRVSIIRQDTANPLSPQLPANTTADPTDIVIGVPYGGSLSSFASNIQTALGAIGAGAITVAAPGAGPQRLTFVGDGTVANRVNAIEARITAATTRENEAALPLFVDGGRQPNIYSGSLDGPTQQKLGFAQRLRLNPEMNIDSSALVSMSTTPGAGAGDPTRPTAMINRLTKRSTTFAAVGGIGTTAAPASGTVSLLMQRVVGSVGQMAEGASRVAEGQRVVVSGLSERFAASTKVNVDEEMARLIELQHAYQASAKVISAADEMMRTLFQMMG